MKTYIPEIFKKGTLSLLVLLFSTYHFTYAAKSPIPVISDFTPKTQNIGLLITVTGTFPSSGTHTLFFGGIKQTSFVSSSSTQLICTVPTEAQYGQITYLDGTSGLQATSSQIFTPTFTSSSVFNGSLLSYDLNYSTGYYNPIAAKTVDLDGDGQLDIIAANSYATDSYIHIFRNISASAGKGFDTRIDYTTGTTPFDLIYADLSGDGLPDLITADHNGGSITLFRNTSSIGNISFETGISIDISIYASNPSALAAGDLNNDGKPELVVTDYTNNRIVIVSNQYTSGSFQKSQFSVIGTRISGIAPYSVTIADLNNDGKNDIAAANSLSSSISVYINTYSGTLDSTIISSAKTFSLAANFNPTQILNADINNDGKTDLVTVDYNSNTESGTISVFRNLTTVSSSIAFDTSYTQATDFTTQSAAIADMDGDGKPEIIATSAYSNSFFFRNNSSSGNLSFSSSVSILSEGAYSSTAIGDINGDDKPDLIVTNQNGSIDIFTNQIGTEPIITSITPSFGYPGTPVTILGAGFYNVSQVLIGNSYTYTYNVISDNLIEATVGNFNTGPTITTSVLVSMTNYMGQTGYSLSNFTLLGFPTPSISGFNPTIGYAGTMITVTGTGLDHATEVTLGSYDPKKEAYVEISCSYTVVSPTIMIVKLYSGYNIPDVSTPQSITVYSTDDKSYFGQSSGQFTVLPYPIATITGFSPTIAMPYSLVTITGSGFDWVDKVQIPSAYYSDIISQTNTSIVARIPYYATPSTGNSIVIGRIDRYTNDVYASQTLDILPYSGSITGISIPKLNYTTAEELAANYTTTGVFPPYPYNSFYIELSDSSGGFSSPVSIGYGIDTGIATASFFDLPLYYIMNAYERPSGIHYAIRLRSVYPSFYSDTISNIAITKLPAFQYVDQYQSQSQFYPTSGTAGTPVNLFGYNFLTSVNGVQFNGIDAPFEIYSDNIILATVPGGGVYGKVRILYGSGQYTESFGNFGDPVNCGYIDSLNVSGTIFTVGQQANISLYIQSRESSSYSDTLIAQISDQFGSFASPVNIGILYTGPTYENSFGSFSITGLIPSNAIAGSHYRIRVYSKTNDCISNDNGYDLTLVTTPPVITTAIFIAPINNLPPVISIDGGSLQLSIQTQPDTATDKAVIWIISDTTLASIDTTGLLKAKKNGVVIVSAILLSNSTITNTIAVTITNQYVPVTGMYILGQDSLHIISYATPDLPINAVFQPTDATNKKYSLQIIQDISYVAQNDTSNIISLNKSLQVAPALITVIGTSLDNPTITGMWVVTVISGLARDSTPISQRPVATGNVKNQKSPCNGTLELYITGDFITYQWFLIQGNDTLKVVGANASTYTPVLFGNYFVMAVKSDKTIEYLPISATIAGIAKPTITGTGNAVDTDTLLTANTDPSGIYRWYVNNKLIRNATGKSLRVWYNGSYFVSTSDKDSCKTTSLPYEVNNTGFKPIGRAGLLETDTTIENYGPPSISDKLKIFPNPSDKDFTLEYESDSYSSVKIQVFTLMGGLIGEKTLVYNGSLIRTHTIKTDGLPAGIYYLVLTDASRSTSKKLVLF